MPAYQSLYRLNENSIRFYRAGDNITIDEQLLWSQARCSSAQFVRNKADKYGLNFCIAADVMTKYICNALSYLGEEDTHREKDHSESTSLYVW